MTTRRWITKTRFAEGTRGSYFVNVRNGERLPCLHDEHRQTGNLYHEQFYYDPATRKGAEYIAAVSRGRVVMTRSVVLPNGRYKRLPAAKGGYIDGRIFHVTDVRNDPVDGFSCRIVGGEPA